MYLVISCFDVFLISLFGQVIYNQVGRFTLL